MKIESGKMVTTQESRKVEVVFKEAKDSPLAFLIHTLPEIYDLQEGQVTTIDGRITGEGLTPVVDHRNRWGYINEDRGLVIPCIYKHAYRFGCGLAEVVNEKGECGYIDQSGNLVISFRWRPAKENFHARFVDNRAVVCDGDKFGIIDTEGNPITPCRWLTVNRYCDGIALVRDFNGRYGYIDREGGEVSPCRWLRANDFSEGLGVVEDEHGYGAIDRQGRVVIPCDSRRCMMFPFSEGLAEVGIQFHGEQFEEKQGRCVHVHDFKIGFINRQGEMVIAAQYVTTTAFHGGLAAVRRFGGKWGLIDKQGELVVPFKWKTLSIYRLHDKFRCSVTDGRGKSFEIDYFYDQEGQLVARFFEFVRRREGHEVYLDEKIIKQTILRKGR